MVKLLKKAKEKSPHRLAVERKQKAYIDAGLCKMCGEVRNKSKNLCDKHLKAHRLYLRKRKGFKKHREGKAGRPPL